MVVRGRDQAEPTVIDDELIRKCISIPDEEGSLMLKKDATESTKDSKKESLEFHEIKALIFSFKNILRVDNLSGLDHLRKLQLDNNIIEKIENLSSLTNLTWLDLSFNNIEKIDGLETLVHLTDLSLFSNKISVVENLDTLTNLQVLSLGNNAIKEMENTVKYLRKFKSLRCLNLAGNPIHKDPEYRNQVLAYVKGLTYLDFRLVDEAAVQAAREALQSELQELEEREADAEKETQVEEARRQRAVQVGTANLAGVDTLFGDMTKDNGELAKIRSLPVIHEPLDEYKDKFKVLTDEYIELVFKHREKMADERGLFDGALGELRGRAEAESKELIVKFNVVKKRALRQIKDREETVDVQEPLDALKAANERLMDDLMEIEIDQVERVEALIKEFDKNYQELALFVREATQAHFNRLRGLENEFHERIQELAYQKLDEFVAAVEAEAAAAASGAVGEEEEEAGEGEEAAQEFNDEARALLQDKETLANALTASHELHTSRIDEREEEIIRREMENYEKLVARYRNDEVARNRSRVSEIWTFVERNRQEMAQYETEDDEGGL